MTENRPQITIKQIIIRDYNNQVAYKESFHFGVNVIRGKNSSGKSTIANFIFYILGGAFNNWTSEARKCKDVTVEVLINGAEFTLRRDIGDSVLIPLQIFWGNYEKAKSDGLNWKIFPYKSSESVLSFSNILFNALDFPEVKGDLDSNITMHQILRLLYIDQETHPQSLFRFENFDPPLTRKTISEILLGIYDDSLYSDRINLRDKSKNLELKEREYKNLINVISHSGVSANRNTIEKEIKQANDNLNKISSEIQSLRDSEKVRTTKKTETNTEKIKKELISYKNQASKITTKINQYDLEIADSKQFISTLNKRISELYNSILTRKTVGDLTLTHCPQCLEKLSTETEDNHCKLCKQPLEEEAEKANAKRLLQEMQIQVKESSKLLEEKEKKYAEFQGQLPLIIERLRYFQNELDSSISNPQSTRNERIDNLLISKGFIESEIENLTKHLQIVELIEQLKSEISDLTKEIKELKLSISEKENDQKYKYSLVLNKIREITISILRKDLPRQDEFRTGKIVEIDFLRDSFTLDGSNNFSASSKTFFKNAVIFSIFFASLEFDFMRYPRFIICDNMEDKGMEKERTQNFQELITKISDSYLEKEKTHQIIFTTSMVSDELNNSEYCVGDDYDTDNKTLKV
ncbi:AAA family ATPase [Mesoflavibacter zeaxanthinifaciens]|uniref:AAA family ATPase n=1 Tax=Mesoflavibacter zeaxanthinifaciens TaxID=393060 RepID=UPI003A925E38